MSSFFVYLVIWPSLYLLYSCGYNTTSTSCSLLILIIYADGTKNSIKDAGEAAGQVHASLSISDSNQCTMMNALVDQMKDSCNFKWSEEVYVKVASAYMTGFNSKAGDSEKKDDFVAFCNLGSIWE